MHMVVTRGAGVHGSVLQCVLQCVLQSVLQCVSVCCSVLYCITHSAHAYGQEHVVQACMAVCVAVCVAVGCRVFVMYNTQRACRWLGTHGAGVHANTGGGSRASCRALKIGKMESLKALVFCIAPFRCQERPYIYKYVYIYIYIYIYIY